MSAAAKPVFVILGEPWFGEANRARFDPTESDDAISW